MQNRSFVLLLAGFGLGLGVFNALTTLVDQIVNPFGYNTVCIIYLGLLPCVRIEVPEVTIPATSTLSSVTDNHFLLELIIAHRMIQVY